MWSSQGFYNGVLFLNSCSLIILLGGMKSGMIKVTILVWPLLAFHYRNQALSKPCFSLMLFFQPTFFLFLLFQVSDLHCESYLCQPLASFFLPLPNTRAILNLVSYTEQGVLKRTLQTCPSSNESCLLSELHQTLYFLTEFYHSRLF